MSKYVKHGYLKAKKCHTCGAVYQGGPNACRCPACQEEFKKAYAFAYAHGVFLDRDNWKDYHDNVYLKKRRWARA